LFKQIESVKVHKDKDPLPSKNNAIYKIFCKNCEASYVGQTKRRFKTRVKEHKKQYQTRSIKTFSHLPTYYRIQSFL